MSQHSVPSDGAFAPYQENVLWNRQRFFRALTQQTIPPGGQTTYDESPPVGFNGAEDVTSFVYGQRAITSSSWPDIMYLLNPPTEWHNYQKATIPEPKRDANNAIIYERWARVGEDGRQLPARPLRDFPGLPDQISSNEKWWRLVLWRRLFPNLLWDDVMMRMQPEVGSRTEASDKAKRNSLNMQCCRTFNVSYNMVSWHIKGSRSKPRQVVLDALTDHQKDNNTTRGSTPGLIDPALGDVQGNRVHPPLLKVRQGTRIPGGRRGKRKASELEQDDGDEDYNDMGLHDAFDRNSGLTMGGGTHTTVEGDSVGGPHPAKKRKSKGKPTGPNRITCSPAKPYTLTGSALGGAAEQDDNGTLATSVLQRQHRHLRQHDRCSAARSRAPTAGQRLPICGAYPLTRLYNANVSQIEASTRAVAESHPMLPGPSFRSMGNEPGAGKFNEPSEFVEGFNEGWTHTQGVPMQPPLPPLAYGFGMPEPRHRASQTDEPANPYDGFRYNSSPQPLGFRAQEHDCSSPPASPTGFRQSEFAEALHLAQPSPDPASRSRSGPVTRQTSLSPPTNSYSALPIAGLHDDSGWNQCAIDPRLLGGLEGNFPNVPQ